MNYFVINNIRGFLCESFDYLNEKTNHTVVYNEQGIYERPHRLHLFIHKVLKLHIFDYFGVFQILHVKKDYKEFDGLLSYNRFAFTNKPYYIVLENPYALVNYADRRMNYCLSNKRITSRLEDENLKGIICISKTCMETFNSIYNVRYDKLFQIYPLIPNGSFSKDYSGKICALYVSSDFFLKGGKEILLANNKLDETIKNNLLIQIVTPLSKLDMQFVNKYQSSNIEFLDYNLSKKEMHDLYEKTHIILNPTRMDSFSLVTLEAIKYGCVYVGTDLYAIPEMVDSDNGFLSKSSFSPWDTDNHFNHRKHIKMPRLSLEKYTDDAVVDFLVESLTDLVNNKELLKRMGLASYEKAESKDFDDLSIVNKWSYLLEELNTDENL